MTGPPALLWSVMRWAAPHFHCLFNDEAQYWRPIRVVLNMIAQPRSADPQWICRFMRKVNVVDYWDFKVASYPRKTDLIQWNSVNAYQYFSLLETYIFSFFSIATVSSSTIYRTVKMEENIFKQKSKLGHPDWTNCSIIP